MKPASIFTNFLTELGVPHTRSYSDRRFEKMTFKSLFGLSKLLQSYGATYVAALLGINSLSPSLDRNTGKEDEL